MGQLFSRSRPEENQIPAPCAFPSPFTDATAMQGFMTRGQCVNFNLRWIDCLEAYGQIQGKEKCADLLGDFQECTRQFKQLTRVEHMKNERDRQWFQGLLGNGPRVPKNLNNVPSYDFFLPDYDLCDP